MKITRACDYALRALVYMSKEPLGTVFMRSDLSKASDVPDSFLGKILQNLAKSNILISERGKKGGFRIERKPSEISMHDVVTAIEGELAIIDCLNPENYCARSKTCKISKVWCDVQNDIINKLKSISLADLV